MEDEKEISLAAMKAQESLESILEFHAGTFCWRDLRYTVPVGGKEKHRYAFNFLPFLSFPFLFFPFLSFPFFPVPFFSCSFPFL
jgi:hypothetical protein